MADARTQYIQERLEAGLEGWDPSPSVSSFLEQAKNKQVCPQPGSMHAAVDRPTRNSRGGRARTTAPQAFSYAGIGRRGSPRAASRAGAPFGLRSESVAVLRARTGNTLCRSEPVLAERAERAGLYI